MKSILKKSGSAFTLILLIFFSISFNSCSKNDDGPRTGEIEQLVVTPSAIDVGTGEEVFFQVSVDGNNIPDTDIFVEGSLISGYSHIFTENGTYQIVSKKENYKDSNPLAMTVTETVVYLAGDEIDASGNTIAKYWRNGVPVDLSDGTNYASGKSIIVVNNVVYVAGYENNSAKYWKNGTPVNLTDGSRWSAAASITVVNNDVYVAGFEDNASGKEVAKYWKNGNPIILTDGSNNAEANSIVVTQE